MSNFVSSNKSFTLSEAVITGRIRIVVPQSIYLIHVDSYTVDEVATTCGKMSLPVRRFDRAEDLLKADVQTLRGCLVSDVVLPGMSGMDLIDELKSRKSKIPAIILTAHGTVRDCARAFKSGVMDFIEIPFEVPTLVATIRRALKLDTACRQFETEKALVSKQFATLSSRRRQVLSQLVAGKTRKQIADELGVTQQTIARHHVAILQLFDVESDICLIRKLADALLLDAME